MAKQPHIPFSIQALLSEPSASFTLNDDTVDETVTETRVFLLNPDDEDSDVIVARTHERNGNQEDLTVSAWQITNAPTISSVTTDATDTATVNLSGTTVLTISGSNFGAEDEDLEVFLFVRQKNKVNCITPTPFQNRIRIPATITNVSVGDDEITATVALSSLYGYDPGKGSCEVQILNKKRLLVSEEFPLTVV